MPNNQPLTPDEAIVKLARLLKRALPLAEFVNSNACINSDLTPLSKPFRAIGIYKLPYILQELVFKAVRQENQRP